MNKTFNDGSENDIYRDTRLRKMFEYTHINSSKLRLYPFSNFLERETQKPNQKQQKSETPLYELSNAGDPFVTRWLCHKPPFKKWVPVRLTAA